MRDILSLNERTTTKLKKNNIMSKRISQNVAKILDKLKEYYGIKTDTELSKALGVGTSTVSNWRLRDSINYDVIFSKIKDIDMNWLLYDENVESSNDYSKVKKVDHKVDDPNVQYLNSNETKNIMGIEMIDIPAHMSDKKLFNIDDYPRSRRTFDLSLPWDTEKVKCIRVLGNSMEGSGIHQNDIVFFRTDDKLIDNRQVIANYGGTLIIKTVRRKNGKYVLYSDYAHETKPITVGEQDNLTIIGVVVAVLQYR